MTWTKLTDTIAQNHTFILSSHINPDGDCISALLSLHWYLTTLGKEAIIYLTYPVPSKFHYLKNVNSITDKKPQGTFDVFVIADASCPKRLGWDTDDIAPTTINIDHHRDNYNGGDVNIVDHNAAATCHILYRFFTENNITYPLHVAEALCTGIFADTGGLRFSNTTSEILEIAASLSRQGVDTSVLHRSLYSSYSTEGLLLRSKAWSTLHYFHNNKIGVMQVDITDVAALGDNYGDMEGLSDAALGSVETEVGIFIKHSPMKTHFSLRSKGMIDVGAVAQLIPGGGGHNCAAGCTILLPIEQAKQKLIDLLIERFS